MSLSVYEAMQKAVDVVNSSKHENNKIASCLVNEDQFIARTNYRPKLFIKALDPDMRVGKSSQFIHSEIACLYNASFPADGGQIFITDPPCPNCAKAICESGVTHVYIDHKGLDKDFANRRGDDFQSLSLLVFEKAGIPVSIIYRKEERTQPLIETQITTRRSSAKGIEFFDWDNGTTLKQYLEKFRNRQAHTSWALGKIRENNHDLGIIVFEELTPGLTPRDYADNRKINPKYRLPVDPLNRLMIFTKRKGFELQNKEIAVNLAPSSRALVNACGYGLDTIYVGENKPDHDDLGHIAAELIQEHNIINIEYL